MRIKDFIFRKRNRRTRVFRGDKPNVGLVVTTFDKGGLEQVVLNLYFGYKNAGYNVYMLCQNNILGIMAEQVESDNMIVFNNSMEIFLDNIFRYNINVLHYHYNIFGCEEARRCGVYTIYTMHNVYTWKDDNELKEYNKYLQHMDAVVAVSSLVKNYYLTRVSEQLKNICVINNGIDFLELANKELPHSLERKSLGFEESDVLLGFVASFYPVKYQIGMIGVMEDLIKDYPNIHLLFVGNSENDYYKDFIKEYEQSVAKDNIHVISYFEHKYMGSFLRNVIDIFTLPTLQEGCSNAVLEAVYCEKPMVLTNVGNAMEVDFLESCVVVNPAYDDITKVSNEEILQISKEKDSKNKAELVSAFLKMVCNLDFYKGKACLSESTKKEYETKTMVERYIHLIEETYANNKNQE